MAEKRPALGRGLGALIPSAPLTPPAAQPPAAAVERPRESARPNELDIDLLSPNPRQPRQHIEPAILGQFDWRIEIVAPEAATVADPNCHWSIVRSP